MDTQGTIAIERPLEEVWAFLQETRNDFAWQADLLQETVLYESPTDVGTKVREVRRHIGESTWEITEVIPMRSIAYKSISGPMPYEGVYLFEEVGGTTMFTSRTHVELRGPQKLIGLLVKHPAQKQLTANLQRLKSMLEM